MNAPHLDFAAGRVWKSVNIEEYKDKYSGGFCVDRRVDRGAVDFEISPEVVDNPVSKPDFFEAGAAMRAVNEELDTWGLADSDEKNHISAVSIILHKGDEQAYSAGTSRYHIYCDIRKSPEEIKKYLRSQREVAQRFIRANKQK